MRTPSAWRETPDAQRVTLRRLVIILHTLNDGFWILSHCHIVASARNIVSARRGERGGRDNSTTELLYIIIYNNFKLLLFLFFFYYFLLFLFFYYLYFFYFFSIFIAILPIFLLLFLFFFFLLLSFLSLEPAVLSPLGGAGGGWRVSGVGGGIP